MPAAAIPTPWVHGHDAINPRAFKQAMRAVAGSVAILASEHDEVGFCGITATAVCSFSAEPPSLLACVNRGSTFASAIREGVPFSVNLPAGDQENVARAFGGMTKAKGVARFSSGSWVRGGTGAPLLVGARAMFECRVAEIIVRASHMIVIGIVSGVALDRAGRSPVFYAHGRFLTVGDEAN
ncbi:MULTISPECIES: flavin reductase family protein [unclassified Mesorhizobium]|uniref:flavin reductase family protein n=1 Tax=unclassified Mesorhizobium TaxID=325217 RepID=UPI000F74E1A5|nr:MULTISPECIES: flavin reductase family protein [unclassified Mesorhizobium]AZO64276.1 flavin reductase [Mesorhizobium sp. M6A.T.Cr.TU.016.01.1.1]RWP56396.1 MAG: flavin reductase [Mesorhizobium sp.]